MKQQCNSNCPTTQDIINFDSKKDQLWKYKMKV